MSDQDIFNTPEQETVILVKELSEIKDILRELSRKLSRIEARASRAFPAAFVKAADKPRVSREKTSTDPTMSAEQVMHLYDELVQLAKDRNVDQVRIRLERLEFADLNFLRTELGVSLGKKKPSGRVLIEAILGRVNESVMLTRHVNRTQLINPEATKETMKDQSEKEHS